MRAFVHEHSERLDYFHLHPWHSMASLLASIVLAALVVLALVDSLK
jgi:hypothetical protein